MSERPPHQVRLIGGRWKRSKLPVADKPGLRPTPDRVRETLFNWLGQDLSGWRVLDAFAGSGALGFEAASRGADEVVMLERDGELVRNLEGARQRLGAQQVAVHATDALSWLKRCAPGRFELILLDPPFDAGLLVPALAEAARLAVADGYVYVESGAALPAAPAGLVPWRTGRAGAVHHGVFRRRYTSPLDSRGTDP